MRTQSRMSLIAGMALVVLIVFVEIAKAEEESATSLEKGRIMTEEQFRATLVGMKIDLGQGYAINHENGKITGKIGDKKLTGKWAWKGEYYCRIVRLDGEKMPFDCQVQIVSGNKVTVIRKKGKGERITYRILGPE